MNRRQFLLSSAINSFGIICSSSYSQNSQIFAWNHIRDWNKEEFNKYSQWVENIYNFKRNGTSSQKGAKLGRIIDDNEMNLLNNPDFLRDGNPQISSSEMNLMTTCSHCGSFPMLLFLYYSARRGLPAIVSKIKMERGGDIRYSYGNHPIGHVKSMPFSGSFGDFILSSMEGVGGGYNFVSGNFRTSPELEGTDSLPIKISREFVKPGTMAYNANGHCLVVGKVDDSGEVHFLDSHPDHSITFNQTLSAIQSVNSSSDHKKWNDGLKIIRLARVRKGQAIHFTNSEMSEYGFSLDQYESKISDYESFVRNRLRIGTEKPIEYLNSSITELGEMMKERAKFVNEGWRDVLTNGSIVFPNDSTEANIYQADGRWETWSSPSSDVDRKNKYNSIGKRLEAMVSGYPSSPAFDYEGFTSKEQLIDAIKQTKEKLFSEQKIIYTNSSGIEFALTLNDVEKRLFDMSFDPNHAPELRWGAPETSKEREGMKIINTPLRTGETLPALKIYELERGLRYYPERQATPSSLNPANNPKEPPFKPITERF
ncbi:MAG TPA: hypothetical protein P5277_00680 [Candidatus Paceibacterota bacterium]|nr:hypothetical protein [Candidatus Paceibacterota bacterium]